MWWLWWPIKNKHWKRISCSSEWIEKQVQWAFVSKKNVNTRKMGINECHQIKIWRCKIIIVGLWTILLTKGGEQAQWVFLGWSLLSLCRGWNWHQGLYADWGCIYCRILVWIRSVLLMQTPPGVGFFFFFFPHWHSVTVHSFFSDETEPAEAVRKLAWCCSCWWLLSWQSLASRD